MISLEANDGPTYNLEFEHKLKRMDFSVKLETFFVSQMNFLNEQYLHIHRFWILQ